MKRSTLYVIMVSAFVVLSLIMNISAVISVPVYKNITITWALPLAAIMMVVADILSELFTKKETVLAIILGYAGGLFLSVWLIIGQALVGKDPSNNFTLIIDNELVAHFLPFDALGQSWRFLLAGFIAYVASNAANTGLMWLFKAKDKDSKVWKRITISTIAGQILDNTVFLILAFMPIGISALEKAWDLLFWQIVISIGIEILIEVMVSPVTVQIIKKLKYVTLEE